MTRAIVFKNATLYTPGRTIRDPYMKITDLGQIASVGFADDLDAREEIRTVTFSTPARIVPGFIDLHIHGAANADVMDGTEEALGKMQRVLPAEGSTSFLATTLTQTPEEKMKALRVCRRVSEQTDRTGANLLGVHLEGPFISEKRAGAQPAQFIRKADIALFEKFQEASGGRIRLVTIAPEEDEEGLVEFLHESGVIPSIGHSDAHYEEVVRSIERGVRHATHLFNGMRGIHHRDPGTAGGVLLHAEIAAEVIADGIHIAPSMLKFAYRQKGADGIILITDAMRAKGMGEGTYQLGGQDVTVKNGQATLGDGTLAGSILKMNEAVRNMIAFTGCSFEEAVRMAAFNPAKQLGIEGEKGSLDAGKDADFVILDEDFEVLETYVAGRKVYG
ncbi:N-acetylglucosamine-6-phosphate deacetylase [Alteribacter lacisalsi]|uniref:N-acetylglucosamine-6-phosphate deacetylase n=1 Tax=Alteribacter lacisalsi TaxID=2045244 RepID=A0A2W0H764_9BACI|nr:N-acetylglucosamine-6-phosphate deacetylase [Alteribacter lacisalsi]PYZ95940.1 N-acetylglucosamine-6-phosphate deacetylase [Alteribacter lacisalsi]